jgi:hypothetical protein
VNVWPPRSANVGAPDGAVEHANEHEDVSEEEDVNEREDAARERERGP